VVARRGDLSQNDNAPIGADPAPVHPGGGRCCSKRDEIETSRWQPPTGLISNPGRHFDRREAVAVDDDVGEGRVMEQVQLRHCRPGTGGP
jgi:hypothetical protein